MPMKNAHRALTVLAIVGAEAHAGIALGEMRLEPSQMANITAGATSLAALQASALGKNTSIQSLISNAALDLSRIGVAQSRSAILATGQSVDASSASEAMAGPFVASAESVGAASGKKATVRTLALATAVDTTLPKFGTVGFVGSLAAVLTSRTR